jgi:hypothetical protein
VIYDLPMPYADYDVQLAHSRENYAANRERAKATQKRYREANRERERTRKRLAPQRPRDRAKDRARVQEVRDWMNDLKATTPCADCGGNFPPGQMDWDHLPGFEKVASVSYLVGKGARQQVEEEILKCELVCKPCHTKRGHEREQFGIHAPGVHGTLPRA